MKYRMYSFVLKQLSTIQKGIQTTNAVVEYSTAYHKTSEYQIWSKLDHTIKILEVDNYKDMMELMEELQNSKIKFEFYEDPDLIHITTSIVILADERVWDKVLYPDYDKFSLSDDLMKEFYENWIERIGGEKNAKLREIISSKKLIS